MTTYGTIPTSSPPSGRPVSLEYLSRARELIKSGLGTRRPWREMFDFRSLDLPKSFHDATARVRTNISYFQMNYALLVLFVVFLSLLWHPISLIVFVAMMAVWSFLYFLRDEPLVVFGRLISDRVVLIVLAVLTVVVLLLTHATTNILVSLLVGVAVVLVHAAVRKTEDLLADDEAAGGLLRFQACCYAINEGEPEHNEPDDWKHKYKRLKHDYKIITKEFKSLNEATRLLKIGFTVMICIISFLAFLVVRSG